MASIQGAELAAAAAPPPPPEEEEEEDHYCGRNTVFDYVDHESESEEEHLETQEHLEAHAHEADWERLSDAASDAAEESKGGERGGGRSISGESTGTMTSDLAAEQSTGDNGVVWHAQVVSAGYKSERHVAKDGTLKPRRPMPHIFANDFFPALERVGDRWIFRGPLNGWPALVNLELRSVTCRLKGLISGAKTKRVWDASNARDRDVRPTFPVFTKKKSKRVSVRVTLRSPGWTADGWSEDSAGFLMWFARSPTGHVPPRLFHGEDMIRASRAGEFEALYQTGLASPPQAVRAHMFAHRYAMEHEGPKDMITYHGGLMIEWDHGLFCTIVELAWWNGLGGYGGKSNWCEQNARPTDLYRAMPDGIKAPWKTHLAELRAIDHPARNLDEFKAYLSRHTGRDKRFLDWHIAYSEPVRLSFRSQPDLMRHLLNYIMREKKYSEEARNCQTFAADLLAFLAGKKKVEPYHPLNRVLYKQRTYYFLYGNVEP